MFNIIFVSTIKNYYSHEIVQICKCRTPFSFARTNKQTASSRTCIRDDREAPSFYGVKQRMRGNHNVLEMKVTQDVLVSLGALRLQGDV